MARTGYGERQKYECACLGREPGKRRGGACLGREPGKRRAPSLPFYSLVASERSVSESVSGSSNSCREI
jgi:hypothetical protein